MNKNFKYFLMLFTMLLVVTGCVEKKTDNSLEAAIKKTKDVKSMTMDVSIDFNISADGSNLSMVMGMNGDIYQEDDNNGAAHLFTTVSMFGIKETQESYTQFKDGKVYTYNKGEDGWTYTVEENNSLAIMQGLGLENVEFKSVKEEVSDKAGYTKYSATLDKKYFNDILGLVGETLGEEVEGTEIKQDLTYTIYVKDGYVSIVEIDMTDFLKSMMPAEELEGYDMTIKMTMEMTNQDKVNKIVIPEEIVKNATLEEVIELEG